MEAALLLSAAVRYWMGPSSLSLYACHIPAYTVWCVQYTQLKLGGFVSCFCLVMII